MAKLQHDSTTQVPIWICLLLLLCYMGAGATVFCVYHGDWSFVDSFYFAFTVLWTIGKKLYFIILSMDNIHAFCFISNTL